MVSITLDALKFFHSFLQSLIDLGGTHLPASVATHLGAKIGKIYQKNGILGIENGLEHIYKALNGKIQINKLDDYTYEFIIEYPNNFCPIGGECNPDRAQIIQKSICTPYTTGFLKIMDPTTNYLGDIKECILQTNENKCRYTLKASKESMEM